MFLRQRQGAAAVFAHPDDEGERGIVSGSGRALFTAVLTDDTLAGQVVIEGFWWHQLMPGGYGVNVLTSDKVADLDGRPGFHSTRVVVERFAPSGARFPAALGRSVTL